MKKIMVIGAGEAQLNLIKEAKELEYFVVVCDMRSGTEAEKLCDAYYKVNYMDKEEVLQVALKEKIDGVISNSEPAMLTVAYVAEKLSLPGNSPGSIEILLSKSKFRELQKKTGAYAPECYVVSTEKELLEKASKMRYPIIMKPNQCSGTRGTTRLNAYDKTLLEQAFYDCAEFSRNHKVTVEEYVEMSCLRVNDADVFVLGNEFLWDGWLWEDRAIEAPMLPMTEIYPMAMPEVNKKEIRETVESLLKTAGIRHGEYNVETYYTPDGKLFVIEINPRQAGNYIPQLIEQHTGVNITRLLVSTSVNDMTYYEFLKSYKRQCNFVTLQVVFSKEEGVFEELFIDSEIQKYVKWISSCVKKGDKVKKGMNAAEALAFVDMQFDDYETQHKFTDDIEKYIYPILSK